MNSADDTIRQKYGGVFWRLRMKPGQNPDLLAETITTIRAAGGHVRIKDYFQAIFYQIPLDKENPTKLNTGLEGTTLQGKVIMEFVTMLEHAAWNRGIIDDAEFDVSEKKDGAS
ncbi:MAG: hypothetical protein Q9208_007582 [Pyrenodesmia sp. 3 TL-2023]